MFASGGDGGGDDPYNFDIADGFGGSGSKKKSKQSKFGKASLNKTLGASPSTSSLKPQDSSPTPSYSLASAAIHSKSLLRASAPAAPTSALDKAMSFLDKYKEGNSSTAPRRCADVPSATFDEDELEISLSSDSDAPNRKPARKTPSRLKASRIEPELKSQRAKAATPEWDPANHPATLTGMPSSARFATAKELGISLEGPKSAVSPVGLQKNNSTKSIAGGARSYVDICSSSGDQSPGFRLAVKFPEESSTHTSLVRQGSDSEVDSVGSVVAEALEEAIPREDELEDKSRLESLASELASDSEIDASSSLVSSMLERQSGSARISRKDNRETGDTGFARVAPDRTFLGKGMSFDELATNSGQIISSVPDNREANSVDDESDGREGNAGNHARYATAEAATEEEGSEDDYGDDDFEDQDVLMESNSEKPREQHISSETTSTTCGAATSCTEKVVSQQPMSGHRTSPVSTITATANVLPNDGKPYPVTESAGPSVSHQAISPPVGGVVNYREHETLHRPREAWSVPVVNIEETRLLPVSSPKSCTNLDKDWTDDAGPGNNQSAVGRAPPGAREAWGIRPASGASAKCDRSYTPVTTGEAKGGEEIPHIPNADQCQHREGEIARGTGKGEATSVGTISKGGLLIDRSAEARYPIRPPDSEVKVVVRAEAVSSVEYAYDPESGIDLRSCGTQMVGNSAAIQANIAVPGMVGTHSSVYVGHATRSSRIAGVGYQPGEPYAKWGRFSCEMPTSSPVGPGRLMKENVSARKIPLTSQRRCPRSPGVTDFGGDMGYDDGIGGGNNGPGGAGHAGSGRIGGSPQPQQGRDGVERAGDRDASRASCAPSVRGGPAYLEHFLESMAKSQAETRYTWQQVLETARPQCGQISSDEQLRSEDKTGTAGVVNEIDPCLADGARIGVQARHDAPSAVDEALHGIMSATQDSFREQLANMRENLNKIRHRAEVAGRLSYAYSYDSVTDVHDWLARARPPATSPAEALMMIDPSLTPGKAEALAGGGTGPPSPVEPHFNRAEGLATNIQTQRENEQQHDKACFSSEEVE